MKKPNHQTGAWLSPAITKNNSSNAGQESPNHIADKWDYIGLQTILKGKHHELLKVKSNFQNIHIIEAQDIRMYLNDQLQFSSLDERIYHEALVHPAFTLARSRKRVLIVGGGDGLALREVLKYKDVYHVDLVDLDPEVLRVAKNNSILATLNRRSLHDSRVKLHARDAVKFLEENRTPFDIIIVDFPDPTDQVISDLYTIDFYLLLKRSLAHDGLFVCQSNSPEDTPIVFWSIGKTIESAGFNILSYHTIVPSFGDWGFHIGALQSLSWPEKRVQVHHQTLPAKLKEMAYFPNPMSKGNNMSIVNSRRNSVLHEIFLKEILYLE